MRIRSYLALLVFACLLGAYAMEQVLAYSFNNVQTLAEKHNESLLWEKDLQRIENTASQFLISSDLVIGSGNTYLIFGAQNMGDYLINELSQIQANNHFPALSETIHESLMLVTSINNVLDTVADFPATDLNQRLGQLLTEYDPISLRLSRNIQQLSKETNIYIQTEAQFLNSEKQRMAQISWITRVGFSLLIFALWWWANNRICRPLNGLIYSSHRVLAGHEFEAMNNAPTEIIELSNDFKHLTENLYHQASHDPLTELQNRRAFERNLHEVINSQQRNCFLCFVDLDYFKTINDTCGHATGDEILISVAKILKGNVRYQDTVARLGGDEFAILIKDCSIDIAHKMANRIRGDIHKLTYQHENETLHLSASIGVAQKTDNGSTSELLHFADVACGIAKNAGRNTVHLYNDKDEQANQESLEIMSIHQVNKAIDCNRLVLFKQEIQSLQGANTGQYIEVLLRIKDADGTFISPANFFPTVERYRLTSKIDSWVVSAVFQHFFSHPAQLDNLHLISINISGHSLGDGELEQFIIKQIESGVIPPEKLCFEITEAVAITNLQRARSFIDNIKDLGCCFALDDFGSEQSAYANIRDLPTKKIKIDGSLTSNMMNDPLDYTAVKSICDIAKAAKQEVIAQFVEDKKTMEALQTIGVDYAQGFYFSKPTELI